MTAPDPIHRLSKPPMPATRGLSRTLTADALLTDWGRSFRGRKRSRAGTNPTVSAYNPF